MGNVSKYPDSTQFVSAINQYNWATLNTALLKEDYYYKILNRNGYGENMFDWAEMAGFIYNMKARSLSVIEQGQRERTVRNNTAIAVGTAGADINFVVSTSDRNTQGGVPVMVGDVLLCAGTYQTLGVEKEYRVESYDSDTFTAVLRPSSSTARIGTEIPAGTRFTIVSYKGVIGGGMPDSEADVKYKRTYQTAIIDSTVTWEGGTGALEWEVVDTISGGQGVFADGQDQAEFKHRKRMDGAYFFSEENDNANLVATSQGGGSNAIPSTKGVWNWAREAGQEYSYNTWDVNSFSDIKDVLRSQNVTGREVFFGYGTDLGLEIENACEDYLREYSGGTNLYDGKIGKVGFNVREITKNGIKFMLKEIDSFGNPTRFGNDDLPFKGYGLMYPTGMEMAQLEGGESKVAPNLGIGYLNNNGEDRTYVMSFQDGMTGRGQGVTQYDISNLYIKSEMAALVFRPNQLIPVIKE